MVDVYIYIYIPVDSYQVPGICFAVWIILSHVGSSRFLSSLFCRSKEEEGSQGTVAKMGDSGVFGWVGLSWVGLGHISVGLCRVIFSRFLLRFVFVLF